MAGLPTSTSPAPVGALPSSPAGFASQPNYQPAPLAGGREEQANAAFAVGDLYDAFKKAQLENVTQASDLSDASRKRLTQIWQAGADDVNVQNNPQVHKQIAALYKNIGTPPPVNDKGQLDWNAMAPARALSDLSPQFLEQLQEASPADRAAMIKSEHVVGVDPGFLTAPPKLNEQAQSRFRTDVTNMMSGKYKTMSPAAFTSWVKLNRGNFDQVYGAGYADNEILDNPDVVNAIKTNAQQAVDKQAAMIAHIQAQSKLIGGQIAGTLPGLVKQMQLDQAKIESAHTLDKLNGVKTNIAEGVLANQPQMIQAQIAQLQAHAKAYDATTAHLQQLVATAKSSGPGSPLADATKVYQNAGRDYADAMRTYVAAVNGGQGVPPEVTAAVTATEAQYTASKTAVDYFNSPAGQQAVAAAKVHSVAGVPATPIAGKGDGFTWSPTNSDKDGQPVMKFNGKWVRKDRTPANI